MGTVEFDPGKGEGGQAADGAGLETAETKAAEAKPAEAPAAPKPAAHGAMYTMLAREGINAAGMINAALSKRTLGKSTPRRLEVAAPIGQSTGGGKKARQSVTLVAVSGDGAAVMCGWIDAAQKLGELREYREVAQQYQSRFGMRFEVPIEEYVALMKDLENMLKTLGFQLVTEEEDEDDKPKAKSKVGVEVDSGSSIVKTLVWVVAAAVVGGVIAFALS